MKVQAMENYGFFTSQIFAEKELPKKYIVETWAMLLETCHSLVNFLAPQDMCLKCTEILWPGETSMYSAVHSDLAGV